MRVNLENVKVVKEIDGLELGNKKYDLYNNIIRIRKVKTSDCEITGWKHCTEGNKEQESKFTKKQLKESVVDEIIFEGYLYNANTDYRAYFFKGAIKKYQVYLDVGFKENDRWDKKYHISTESQNRYNTSRIRINTWSQVELSTPSFRIDDLNVLKKYSQLVNILPYFIGLVEYWKSSVIIADCEFISEYDKENKKEK